MINGKNSKFKLFWIGNQAGTGGIGIFLAERWIDKVYDITRLSDRAMILKLCLNKSIITMLCVYAPQVGLNLSFKDEFYDNLHSAMLQINIQETLLVCGDFNSHVGNAPDGFEGVYEACSYGEKNPVIGNPTLTKPEKNLGTYK